MKIIIINGSAGAGKSTFVRLAKKSNLPIYELSMVDHIKEIARQAGWDGVKDEKGRRLLSDLKDILDNYDDRSFTVVTEEIEQIVAMQPNAIIFIHVREPNDIKRWVKQTNARTLFIQRKGINHYSNHADCNVYYYDYDYEYQNNKTMEQLEQDAINFVNWINEKKWQSHL